MALKLKITKAAYDKLPDELKNEYREDGNGYMLDVDGLDDTGELKRAKDREKQRADDAETERDELQAKLDKLESSRSRSDRDVERLQRKYDKDMADLKAEYDSKISKRDTYIRDSLLDRTAMELASKISTVPSLMAKAIRERLTVELSDDEAPTVKVLKDGKPSDDMTIDKLGEEFVANKEFSSIIVGTRASGGGAPGRGSQSPAGGAGDGSAKIDLATADTKTLMESIRSKVDAGADT